MLKSLLAFSVFIFLTSQRKSIVRITTGSQALDELLGGNALAFIEIAHHPYASQNITLTLVFLALEQVGLKLQPLLKRLGNFGEKFNWTE